MVVLDISDLAPGHVGASKQGLVSSSQSSRLSCVVSEKARGDTRRYVKPEVVGFPTYSILTPSSALWPA